MIGRALKFDQIVECHKADECVWNIAPKAEWYIPHESFTFLLIPTSFDDEQVAYEVNGQAYKSLGTSPYRILKENLEKFKGLEITLDLEWSDKDDEDSD